jgi:glycoside/pentoside/hexuronide:cation symporter, GPH family
LSDIGDLWRLRQFQRTLACWFVNGIANGLPAVLFPIVVQDYFALNDSDLYGLLVCYFGAAVVAMPLWLMLAQRYGKVRAWRAAIAFNVLVFVQVLWLDQSTAVWFIGICIASGMTLGADLALPPSLQADILGRDRERSGRRRTATAFALWSMATKLALAVAVVAAFAGLGFSGRGAAEGAPADPAVLLSLYVVLPVVLKCGVLGLLGRLDTGSSIDLDTSAQQLKHAPDHRKPIV